MSLEFIPFPWPIAEPINLEPRASLELQPAVPQRGEVGHGCIEFGKFREAIRECSAFLTMIAADGGARSRRRCAQLERSSARCRQPSRKARRFARRICRGGEPLVVFGASFVWVAVFACQMQMALYFSPQHPKPKWRIDPTRGNDVLSSL